LSHCTELRSSALDCVPLAFSSGKQRTVQALLRAAWRMTKVLAFRHTRAVWPVHIVVVPKRHVPSLIDLGDTDEILLHKVLAVVRRVADQVMREYGACRVLTNLGRYQDSKHLHFHVNAGEPLR